MHRPPGRALRWLLIFALVGACSSRPTRVRRPPRSAIVDAPLKFIFFELGQADGLLVLHQGKTLLIDAGESRESSEQYKSRRIAKVLQQLTGARHLDYFLVTHYHQDHVGSPKDNTGLWGLLSDDGVTIGTLLDRGSEIFGDAGKGEIQKLWEQWKPSWQQDGKVKAYRAVTLGEKIELGEGLEVKVVAVNGSGRLAEIARHDVGELDVWPPSENDYSVALKFTLGDFELFTGGDLTGQTSHRDFGDNKEGYHDIESTTAARVGDVEVYRANHHGSVHSSNPCFLRALRPEVSIISTGENAYGHPTTKVFDALSDLGRVFITSGASDRVRKHVERGIVGEDIVIAVEAGGQRFSVNGRDFRSKSEEAEGQVPGRVTECAEVVDVRSH